MALPNSVGIQSVTKTITRESFDVRVAVAADIDIVSARREGRRLAEQLGFSESEVALVATAVSELARSIVNYAGNGEIMMGRVDDGDKSGVAIVVRDCSHDAVGATITARTRLAKAGDFSAGFSGIRRIMDEFNIHSAIGRGVTVTAIKWRW